MASFRTILISLAVLVLSSCTDPGRWIGLELGERCARDGECRSQTCYENVCIPADELPDLGSDATTDLADDNLDASSDANPDVAD